METSAGAKVNSVPTPTAASDSRRRNRPDLERDWVRGRRDRSGSSTFSGDTGASAAERFTRAFETTSERTVDSSRGIGSAGGPESGFPGSVDSEEREADFGRRERLPISLHAVFYRRREAGKTVPLMILSSTARTFQAPHFRNDRAGQRLLRKFPIGGRRELSVRIGVMKVATSSRIFLLDQQPSHTKDRNQLGAATQKDRECVFQRTDAACERQKRR